MAIHEAVWCDSAGAFAELQTRHEPTVFRGLAASWLPGYSGDPEQALRWWSERIGDRIVPVTVGLPGDRGFVGSRKRVGANAIRTTLSGNAAFSAVVREMARELSQPTGHPIYIQSLEVDKRVPEVRELFALPMTQCAHSSGHWRLWMGTGAHRVNLHYDGQENFFCLLSGVKRFTILPYLALPDIYVGPLEGGAYGTPASIVDPVEPDHAKYPRFKAALDAYAETVELSAGDVLYLPCHWWHYVESIGFNVAANYWWSDIDDEQQKQCDLLFMTGLAGVRDLPRHWRDFAKVTLDTFVFRLDDERPLRHLAPEEQGIAGDPTPERMKWIGERIASLTSQKPAVHRSAATSGDGARRYRLASNTSMRVVSPAGVAVSVKNGNGEGSAEHMFPALMVGILAQFVEARSLEDVVAEVKASGLAISDAEVIEPLRGLVAQQVLIPA